MMISLHCSGPPDEILNVGAIYSALDSGKKRVGIAGNAAAPGKDGFLCPTENSWKDQLKVNCPSLKSNNYREDDLSEQDI